MIKPETMAILTRGLALRGVRGAVPRTETDFVGVCISARRDTWMLFPISEVDAAGAVIAVHDQAVGRPVLATFNEGPAVCTVGGKYFDRDEIYAVCWRAFDGFALLDAAMRAIKRDGPA